MKRSLQLLITTLLFLAECILAGPPAYAVTTRNMVCAKKVKVHTARCFAQIKRSGALPLSSLSFRDGLTPQDLHTAYGMGTKATHIAIVTAYNAPNALEDLNTYSGTFGLPKLLVCRSAQQTGCFAKLSQDGNTNYPANNPSWALEASMDTQAAHAMCPQCRISLVEANTTSYSDLATAEDQAVAVGAKIISNSYGIDESPLQKQYDIHYHHNGVLITVSSGDSGFGTNWPAASPNVLAVGGTKLVMNGSRVQSESAWSGAGSGCSKYESKPTWQHDTACARRSIADVSAVADPATGAAVYDSYAVGGEKGWFVVGGTSLASPIVAGVIAARGGIANPSQLYAQDSFKDILSGKNGSCSNYLCKAGRGYDGPTGLGVLHF